MSRADDEVLQELIGAPVVRLLRLIDPALAAPSKLRELLLDFHTPADLMRDSASRNLLLDSMSKKTAEELLEALQVEVSGDAFQTLARLRFAKSSAIESRLFGYFGEVPPLDTADSTTPAQRDVLGNYELFGHQRNAARQATEILSSGRKRLLLHMPTGSGKTRTAMHVIGDHLRGYEPTIVIWLAYNDELCEQAALEFIQAWENLGNRRVSLFRFWGSHEIAIDEVHDGFMVAGLNKMYAKANQSIDFIARLGDRTSLVVIDEAHQAVAYTYSLVLDVLVEKQTNTGLMGLSATPGRTWRDIDQDQKLANFFQRQKVTLTIDGYDNPVDYLIDERYLARPRFEPLLYEMGNDLSSRDLSALQTSLDIPQNVLANLGKDEQRNLLIVQRVEDLVKRHDRIIVFAASAPHARLLAAVLRARNITADAVTAETLPVERSRIITRFRSSPTEPIVLCNYGVLTTGFDAPKTSAAVIARPTKSLVLYSQMIGRALRGERAGGNLEAEIVTVIDTNLPGFRDPAETFFNWEDVWT